MMHAEWSDVDFKARTLHIKSKPELKWWTKSRHARTSPNAAAYANLLLLHAARVDNFVVHDLVIRTNGMFWHRVRMMMKAAGVAQAFRPLRAAHLRLDPCGKGCRSRDHFEATRSCGPPIDDDLCSSFAKHMHDAVSNLNLGMAETQDAQNIIPFRRMG